MASEGWYFRGTMQGQRGAERMAFRLQMTGLEREGLQRPGLRNKKTATPGSVIKVIAMCILQLSHLAVYMKKKKVSPMKPYTACAMMDFLGLFSRTRRGNYFTVCRRI